MSWGCLLLAAGLLGGACGDDDSPAGATEAPLAGATTAVVPGVTRSPAGPTAPPATDPLLVRAAQGLQRPVYVTGAGDGSRRLFVVEKAGRVRIVRDGQLAPAPPFLDITALVDSVASERGLLGLAFHPGYETNGRFFVTYTAKGGGANTLAEYRVSGDSERADAASARVLFAVPDKFSNHNGGMVAFGPDGFLYVAMGDGGSGGDPDGNAQDLGVLLGKVLRLDVDAGGGAPYSIPPGNPFAGQAGARGEVWAYGLRNPWRFSFDRQTGDLWIADVGQNAFEEVDLQPAASRGGENYGWNRMEGDACFEPKSGCDRTGLTLPVFAYGREDGCSVTGGYVYRGKRFPGLAGAYYFADYCEGILRSLREDGGGTWRAKDLLETVGAISSFGEDDEGELYLVADQAGELYRLEAR
ncbi:MAG: PQQ-dependent sugar dehydrogenase [Tepidiformaceae bacterium]